VSIIGDAIAIGHAPSRFRRVFRVLGWPTVKYFIDRYKHLDLLLNLPTEGVVRALAAGYETKAANLLDLPSPHRLIEGPGPKGYMSATGISGGLLPKDSTRSRASRSRFAAAVTCMTCSWQVATRSRPAFSTRRSRASNAPSVGRSPLAERPRPLLP
jgi:hypothetical protein